MEEGIQEMAEKCPREENFQMYLHMRSHERATKKVKESINKARGKGKRISCLAARGESCLRFSVPVHSSNPGQPERALL